MPSSGMLCLVALIKTDTSEECSASNIRMTRISELGTTLAVTSNRRTLRRNNISFVPRENLKPYLIYAVFKNAVMGNIVLP
jgi:hypothetical protein